MYRYVILQEQIVNYKFRYLFCEIEILILTDNSNLF